MTQARDPRASRLTGAGERGAAAAALLVLGVAVLLPSGASGQAAYRYEARTASPAPVAEVSAGGLEWHCEGVSCTARSSGPRATVEACRALASRVGRITSYGRSGDRLEATELEACNRDSGAGPGEESGRGGEREKEGGIKVAPEVVTKAAVEANRAIARKAGAEVRVAADAATAGTAPEDLGPFTFYRLRNRGTDKLLAVSGGHVRDGASAIQWSDRGQRDVLWRPLPATKGTFKLANRNSGRMLAVSGGKPENGQNVIQWEDLDQGDVHWRLEPAGGGWLRLRNAATGKVLIVEEGMRRDGANVVQWEPLDRPYAQWRLEPADSVPVACDADRSIARRVGPDRRPDLEVQDVQVHRVQMYDGKVVALEVQALVRNVSEGTWDGHGKAGFALENGGNHLIKPGTIGNTLEGPIEPGETVRLHDVFALREHERGGRSARRVMKAIATGGASEAVKLAKSARAGDLEEWRDFWAMFVNQAADLAPLMDPGQRHTVQLQLEPLDGYDRWRSDLRLCNNFLQLSFVVDDRGVAKGFRLSRRAPESYDAFHTHTVPVSGR